MEYAGSLGHKVVAVTEHETVSNAIKLEKEYKKAKEKYPELKLIRGNEIYLCRTGLNAENFDKNIDKYFHFILLAKDAIGHQQIRELSSRAWMRSYVTQGKMRRVPTYYEDLIEIVGGNPGHVIGSTACLGGFLGTQILKWAVNGRPKSTYEQIIDWLKRVENIFGTGNFYLEMQPSAGDEQECVNREILNLSAITGIPYIITTDTHYLKKEDAPIHKAFLNSQDGDREVDDFYATTYLMSTEELESYLKYLTPEQLDMAYNNIMTIRNMCEDYSLLKDLNIPSLNWGDTPKHDARIKGKWIIRIPWIEKFITSPFDGDNVMADLIMDKLENDHRLQYQESYDALNENLRMTWISSEVNNAHWSAYFLNLRGILDTCWEAGTLVGAGRGSGVGFYLLYILDLIQINPLWESTKTYPWRFLNPDRVSVLDIDTDIEGGRRAQVLTALREKYGQDRVANVVTFGTEGSKSAIQTAARGLGIDNDISLYISSLIPSDRGKTRTLSQCYYGDEEEGFAPISLFRQQMQEYPELWSVAQSVEGLVCRVGEHAGGVIFVDEPFTNSTALMKVPNGDVVTQFDLHDSEAVSLIKIDLLSVEALDKMHACLDLLCEQNLIERQPTLKETYEKYLGIYNIERTNPLMWKMVWNHEIQALFQMEKQSGVQGIALTKPENVDDLAVLNSVIRLMAQDKGAEQPLNKYARFKNNINLWYNEMASYGLTKQEQAVLEPIVKSSYGICESQEKFMQLVQLPECGGFPLGWADRLRKSIAKKNPAEYEQLTKEYFANVEEKNLSYNLCNYVWNVLVATSRGYGFNASHTLAYSLVGLQEMNLAFRYPTIFWNCACLITDSGGAEEEEEAEVVDIYEPEDFSEFEYEDAPDRKTKKKKRRSNNYDKIATAIGKMRAEGVNITPPDINTSQYTFYPDAENNRILFGFRGMLNVGDDVIAAAIANRPYSSPKDFIEKVNPKKTAMISLIKAGAFDTMIDRKICMGWYLWEICDKKEKLTLQNMPTLIKYGLLPEDNDEFIMARRVYEFNRYLKAITKKDNAAYEGYYTLDPRAIAFLDEIGQEELMETDNLAWFMKQKVWEKVYGKYMDIYRNWMAKNKNEILIKLNQQIFKEEWEKYAGGTLAAWEMEVMCFYYHEHELAHVNKEKYGLVDFFQLPEDPIVANTFFRGGKEVRMFQLSKICGTCIAKDKAKGIVTLLTPYGVVPVKFRKEYFSMFDKQISVKDAEGVKHVMERSWFNRGSMIVVQGIRSGDNFLPKKYSSSVSEQLYKITEIDNKGEIKLTHTRYQGGIEEDD
jgi:DNA polymerase-3 subunit alpha